MLIPSLLDGMMKALLLINRKNVTFLGKALVKNWCRKKFVYEVDFDER